MDTFDSIDRAYETALQSLLSDGLAAAPRGLRTLEVAPFSLTLRNPRRRCVTNPQRRLNLPLAIGEFCWHASGSNELQFIEYYAKRWREFADDGSTIRGSCYGHKIFSQSQENFSQWHRVVELLRKDPESRRAVLNFRGQTENFVADKDVPCANTMQFLVRGSKLHAIVSMRSNDAIWGLPYDVFLFTMFQELLSAELGLTLGTYTHMVGSLHLYERHFEMARRIVRDPISAAEEMPAMEQHDQLRRFLDLEARLRTGSYYIAPQGKQSLHPYWQDLMGVLEWYRLAKEAAGYERVSDRIPLHSPYHQLLLNMASGPAGNFQGHAKHSTA